MTETATDAGAEPGVAPAWTVRPGQAARAKRRWPVHAEEYDAAVELEDAWKRRQDDPRPNVGRSCGGRYFSDDARGGHRFECVRCGLGKVLGISTDRDRRQQIRFACPACRQQTLHNPTGIDARLLIRFGADG